VRPNLIALTLSGALMAFSDGAIAGNLRFGGAGGYGEAAVTSSTDSKVSSPMGFSFSFDYALDSRRVIGAEHIRSLNPSVMDTGVGLTGLFAKWYFWTPMPQDLSLIEKSEFNSGFVQKAISPFVGFGLGMAQGTLLSSDTTQPGASAVGAYLSLKLGAEYPVWKQFGSRAEFNYATTIIGSGSIQLMNFIVGLYMHL
jgi:hypothetical protein